MLGRRKRSRPVRNDPKLCAEVSELLGGPEGAREGLQDFLEPLVGVNLTEDFLRENGITPRRRRRQG